MIRLTRLTDYAIVLLSHVASGPTDAVHTARQLAEDTHLPLPMVGKVLKALTRRGMLESRRGVKGGYRLAQPADTLSIAEVITALEGPIAMTECLAGVRTTECEHEQHCPTQQHWRTINEVVSRALDGITVAHLAAGGPPLRPRLVQLDALPDCQAEPR